MLFFYDDYFNKIPVSLNKVELEIVNVLSILINKEYTDIENSIDIDVNKLTEIIKDMKLTDPYELIKILVKLSNINIEKINKESKHLFKLISSIEWVIKDNMIIKLTLIFDDNVLKNFSDITNQLNNLLVFKNQVTFNYKYSDKVYNLLKTLEYYDVNVIDTELLKYILHSNKPFGYINKFILMKSIEELESKTDLSLYFIIHQNPSNKKAEQLEFIIHQKSKSLMEKIGLKSNRKEYMKKINVRRIHHLIYDESIKIIKNRQLFETIENEEDTRQKIFEELKLTKWDHFNNILEVYDWLDYIKYKRNEFKGYLITFKYFDKQVSITNNYELVDLKSMSKVVTEIKDLTNILSNTKLKDIKLIKTIELDNHFKISYI